MAGLFDRPTGSAFRGTVVSDTEIFDPTTGHFSAGPSAQGLRESTSLATLPNGDVLIVSGRPLNLPTREVDRAGEVVR